MKSGTDMERNALWVTNFTVLCCGWISEDETTSSGLLRGLVFCGKQVKFELPLKRVGQYFSFFIMEVSLQS